MLINLQRLILLTLLFLVYSAYPGHSQTLPYDAAKRYTAEALKADLRFVHDNLEKKHAELYRYITKPELNRLFDSLDRAITTPMTEQAFFSVLTLLHEKIRNGHTMFLPGDSAMVFNSLNGRFLPLQVHFTNRKLTIVENHSTDSTLQPGMEILSINGINATAVMEQLLARQVRDGYNLTYPLWILNNYFSSYYSYAFGQPNAYTLQLKDSAGEMHTKQIPALKKITIQYLKEYRYTAKYPAARDEKGIIFREEKEHNAAILKIKSFSPDLLRYKYQQNYKQVFDSIFKQIDRLQVKNLVLDLRDNQGGDFPPARMLLSYVVQNPSRFLLNGKEAGLVRPQANAFKGKLFVLTNGGSFSVTAIVCACLKRDGRAIFIGEETGGNTHVISGNPEQFILTQTKIKAYISTVQYRIIADTNDGHGLTPDHLIAPSTEDVLAGKDPALLLAMKLIPGG